MSLWQKLMHKMFGWHYVRVTFHDLKEEIIRVERDKFGAYHGKLLGLPYIIDRDFCDNRHDIIMQAHSLTFLKRPSPKLRLVAGGKS